MEYLVTMTTHVPEGTSDATVAEMRAREAAHSHDLAAAVTSFVCGALRCSRASGAASACSPRPTGLNSKKCSPPCPSECGAPTRFSTSRRTRMTRAERTLPRRKPDKKYEAVLGCIALSAVPARWSSHGRTIAGYGWLRIQPSPPPTPRRVRRRCQRAVGR